MEPVPVRRTNPELSPKGKRLSKKIEKSFLERRAELWQHKGVEIPKRGFAKVWSTVVGWFKRTKAPVLQVNTPLVAYNVTPAFDPSMMAAMDAPERAEHIRMSKLRSQIFPTCEYDVLYYTEIPEWVKPHQYAKMHHLLTPKNVLETHASGGVFISLSRARVVAKELASQGAFGAIVGLSPKEFLYETFGGQDDFVRDVINPEAYERSYKLVREFKYEPSYTSIGSTMYEAIELPNEEGLVLRPIAESGSADEQPEALINKKFSRRS